MIAPARLPFIAPADLARFIVAFGLVPLLLAREFQRDLPPWSFALTPTWSTDQMVFTALAGLLRGVTSRRPAHGLAATTLGILLGLAADLWWFAGWVKPYDQAFVTMLPQAEWRSQLTQSALALLGTVSAGFLAGAVARGLVWDRGRRALRRPTGSEAVAVGLAVIGGPLLALGIGSAAASTALVVPDGAQVQTVSVSAGAIAVDLAMLRPGPTRFRCQFAMDAANAGLLFVALREGVDIKAVSLPFDINWESQCGNPHPGNVSVTWGETADLRPGRYVWIQIDNATEVWMKIAISPPVVVAP